MTEDVQDRRDPKAQRKPVTTLVEVCGNVPGVPVFEAESLDVSARGMHLRTAYLPESGTPLVCRFESEGREIVVEGTVAWRREAGRGGEFGVRFTALDSRSVDALRGLCSPDSGASGAPDDAKNNLGGEPGARVRLHIDGLGSPMKARVKTGGRAKVQVGSSLEFLKVGRRLELEDLDLGGRRPAEIDGVSVMVDPSTQIPQLVVALRFEGSDEDTPSPSVAPVMKSERNAEPERSLRIPASAVTTDAVASKARPEPTREDKVVETRSPEQKPASVKAQQDKVAHSKPTEDDDDDAPEMRGAVAVLASNAEKKVKDASEQLARATAQASEGAKSLFLGAAEKIRALRGKTATPPRRTTSPAPGMNSVVEKPKLRPQSGAKPSEEADENARVSRKAIGVAAGASVLAIAGLAMALRGGSAPPAAKAGAETASVSIGERSNAEAPGALGTSNPNGAVTANVPLFGPTSLATTEPAPLGPPPGSEGAAIEEAEKAAARASLTPSRDVFDDEADDNGPGKSRSESEDKPNKSSKRPEDVSPWGHGKMKDPIIHRLRLDAPGDEIQGSVDPTGFTVVLPSRKVMEPTTGITKRDDRIARIKATNNGSGTQISFRFKDGVPAYRVRLRRDFVEFLISEPSPEKPAKSSKNSDNKPRKRG